MSANERRQSAGLSRRKFLGVLGAGAGAAGVAAVTGNPLGGLLTPPPARSATATTTPTAFGRLFPELAPFAEATPKVMQALSEMGKPGGLLDARDDLSAGPVRLITEPALSANNPNNAAHTAGTTFFGQFIDHDTTFDTTSKLGIPAEPTSSVNTRSPSLDLDSVYGGGPVASPQLYQVSDRAKLLVGSGGAFEDLPRSTGNTAIIGDPRNDENLIIAGLHCAFLLFHNKAVDVVRSEDRRARWDDVYRKARSLTTWHYQWLVLHEVLPLFVGQQLVDEILAGGRRFFRPAVGSAFMPVEFQGACYRFGHTMVRPSYRANLKGDAGAPFFGMIFDPAGENQADPVDLRGGARAARRFVGWQTFFDFGDGEVKPNKAIDTRISTPLFHLPLGAIASHDAPQSLPQRNLLRHLTWGLPSGQAIARRIGTAALGPSDLHELKEFRVGFERNTPLWYYALKEGEVMTGGARLGPVGARIVAEVLIGLLQSDRAGYLVARPNWLPTFGAVQGQFRIVDFLRFAGVDPVTRHAAKPDLA